MVRNSSQLAVAFFICVFSAVTLLHSTLAHGGACQKSLADQSAAQITKDRTHEAEWAPRDEPLRQRLRDEILPFDPHIQNRMGYLADMLREAPPQSLRLSPDFSTASFSQMLPGPDGHTVLQSSTFSLFQDRGYPSFIYFTFQPTNTTLSALSSGSHTAFFLGSDVGKEGIPSNLALRTEAHLDTLDEVERSKADLETILAKNDELTNAENTPPQETKEESSIEKLKSTETEPKETYSIVSEHAVVIDTTHGVAVGTHRSEELYFFEIKFEEDGTPYSDGMILRDAAGEPIRLGSAQYPELRASHFLFDPNTRSLAMKVPSSDPANPLAQFNFLEKRVDTDSYFLTANSFFHTHEALPHSYAFLPFSRTVAFRDAQGNFFIRHADVNQKNGKALFEIRVPRALSKRDAVSDEVAEALSFPKVVSVDDYEGGQFVILRRDGNTSLWDSRTGRSHTIKSTKLFNQSEKKSKASKDTLFPGLVNGISIHQEGLLTAMWGENCIKIFDTLTSIELRKFNLPKEAHGSISNVLFSPDASAVLVSFKDGSASLFETKSGTWVQNFKNNIADQFIYGFAPYNLNYQEDLMPPVRPRPSNS